MGDSWWARAANAVPLGTLLYYVCRFPLFTTCCGPWFGTVHVMLWASICCPHQDYIHLHREHSDWVTKVEWIPEIGLVTSSLDTTIKVCPPCMCQHDCTYLLASGVVVAAW